MILRFLRRAHLFVRVTALHISEPNTVRGEADSQARIAAGGVEGNHERLMLRSRPAIQRRDDGGALPRFLFAAHGNHRRLVVAASESREIPVSVREDYQDVLGEDFGEDAELCTQDACAPVQAASRRFTRLQP